MAGQERKDRGIKCSTKTKKRSDYGALFYSHSIFLYQS